MAFHRNRRAISNFDRAKYIRAAHHGKIDMIVTLTYYK